MAVNFQNPTSVPCNYTATIAPTIDEDSGDGYLVGSHWYDVSADKIYICIDNSSGAAIWRRIDIDVAGLELIDSYVVSGAAVSEIAFDNISGNDYSELILSLWLYNPGGDGAKLYSLMFQDDSTSNHYYEMYYYHAYGDSPTYGADNNFYFQQLETTESGFVVMSGISIGVDSKIRYFKSGIRNNGATMIKEAGARYYTEDVTEITDITIYQGGNYIGIGSKAMLYGKKV